MSIKRLILGIAGVAAFTALYAGTEISQEAQRHLKAGIEMIKNAKTLDDYDNAIVEFEQVTRLAPGYADGYYYLGETLASTKGKSYRAMKNLNKYLELSPSDAPDRAEILEEIVKLKSVREKERKTELNGLELVHLPDGIYVRSVVEGSSFLGGRLRKGDKIVSVAGQSVQGMDMDQFYEVIYNAKEEIKNNRRFREGPGFVVEVIRAAYGDKETETLRINLNKETFFSELYDLEDDEFTGAVADNEAALIIFWRPKCTECSQTIPIVETIAVQRKGQIKAYSINVAENFETAQKLQIQNVPTVLLYVKGTRVEKLEGIQTKEKLTEVLNSAVGPFVPVKASGR
jgi:thiol-disulfide isomerase/thioredoxin